MEELTLTTPSILFSAISLIMLAYTNRFLAYATVIRNLKVEHENNPTAITEKQIENLRKRLYITRSMQIFGVMSLLLCVVCTFFIYVGWQLAAVYILVLPYCYWLFLSGYRSKNYLSLLRPLSFTWTGSLRREKKSDGRCKK